MKKTGFNLAYVLIAALGVLALQDWYIRSQAVATIPYSEFQKLVREDKIVMPAGTHEDTVILETAEWMWIERVRSITNLGRRRPVIDRARSRASRA